MHNVLVILAVIWFAFLAPPRVVAITAAGAILIAFSVRAIATHVAGAPVALSSSIKAVSLSLIFFTIALLFLVGGFQHFTFAVLVALNPAVVPAILLVAYILGFHLCLPTSFGGSAVVAVLSTLASVAIIFGLRSVA